jgi:hypothetical protein
MPQLFEINDQDKHACVLREIRLRIRVYPRLVARQKMTQEAADREIALMEEIARDYQQRISGAKNAAPLTGDAAMQSVR